MPRPLHVLAALSLLACIALAVAWDQSRSTAHVFGHLAYRTHDDGSWRATGVMFNSAGGAVGIQFATARSTDPALIRSRQAQPPGWYHFSTHNPSHPRSSSPPRRHELCGFGFARGPLPLSLEKLDDRATAAWVPTGPSCSSPPPSPCGSGPTTAATTASASAPRPASAPPARTIPAPVPAPAPSAGRPSLWDPPDDPIIPIGGEAVLARLQRWLDRVANRVGGEDQRKAYYAERLLGPHAVRGSTLAFANCKSVTLAADIVQTRQTDPGRLIVLTAKPPPGAAEQWNLLCVNGLAERYWESPRDQSRGHYTAMEVEPDRLALTTDAGWHVELGLPYGQRINEWRIKDGPRYRVADSALTFTGGRTVEFGSRILETVDAGALVIVRTERGTPDSPAENIAAVDELRFVWRIPEHPWARDEKGRRLTYTSLAISEGRVIAMGSHFTLFCDPMTGAILQELAWR